MGRPVFPKILERRLRSYWVRDVLKDLGQKRLNFCKTEGIPAESKGN